MSNLAPDKFEIIVSQEILRTQSINVIRDVYDILEELITNSYDQYARNPTPSQKPLLIVSYEKISKEKSILEILDFCGGMSSSEIETKLQVYGSSVGISDLRGRGQFSRGLREVFASAIDRKKTALVVSHKKGDIGWAYDVSFEKNTQSWKQISSKDFFNRLHNLIPEERKDKFSIEKGGYFYVKIPLDSRFSVYQPRTINNRLEKDLKICRIWDNIRGVFHNEGRFKYLINEEKHIKPRKNGFIREVETNLDLSRYRNKFNVEVEDSEAHIELEKLLKTNVRFKIFEVDLDKFQSFNGFKQKSNITSTHPDITVEGVCITDGVLGYDKIDLFPKTDEFRILYMVLEIPDLKIYSILASGFYWISGPPLISTNRTGVEIDHPIFDAFRKNIDIQNAFKDALKHIQLERENIIQDYQKSVMNEITEKAKRVINRFLKDIIKKDTGTKTTTTLGKSISRTKNPPKPLPLIGIPFLENKNGRIRVPPGHIREEKIVCFRGLVKENAQICINKRTTNRELDFDVTDYDPDIQNQSLYNPYKINMSETEITNENQYYRFTRWVSVPGAYMDGDVIQLSLSLKKKDLTKFGVKLVEWINSLKDDIIFSIDFKEFLESNLKTKIEDIEKPFMNWSTSSKKELDEVVLSINYEYIVKEGGDETNFFRIIDFVKKSEINDPVTQAIIPNKVNSLPYYLTNMHDGYYLYILLRSKYFQDCFNQKIDLHKQDEIFYREIGNILSIAVGNILSTSPYVVEKQPIDHILNAITELSSSLREIFCYTRALEDITL